MPANDRQVGGEHYKGGIEHWDYVIANEIPYLEAQIIRYVVRHKKKNGLTDLEKARHFLEKLIEVETRKQRKPLVVEGNRLPPPEVIDELKSSEREPVTRLFNGPPKDVSANGVKFVEDQHCQICDTTRGVQGPCSHQLLADAKVQKNHRGETAAEGNKLK